MRITEDSKDIRFTGNGDFSLSDPTNDETNVTLVSSIGDLEVLDSSHLEVYKQSILNRFMSNPGDYVFNRTVGVNFSQFLGMPNTAETGSMIKSAVFTELTRDNLISPENLEISVFPTSKHTIAVLVFVTSLPSTLGVAGFTMGFTYDMRYNQIIPRKF